MGLQLEIYISISCSHMPGHSGSFICETSEWRNNKILCAWAVERCSGIENGRTCHVQPCWVSRIWGPKDEWCHYIGTGQQDEAPYSHPISPQPTRQYLTAALTMDNDDLGSNDTYTEMLPYNSIFESRDEGRSLSESIRCIKGAQCELLIETTHSRQNVLRQIPDRHCQQCSLTQPSNLCWWLLIVERILHKCVNDNK